MNTRQKAAEVFNKQITDLIAESVNVFPELKQHPSLIKLQNSLMLALLTTPEVPVQVFYANVVSPYSAQIDAKDEHFFLVTCEKIKDDSVKILKSIYTNTHKENKEIIWKYFARLKTISLQYNKLQNQ